MHLNILQEQTCDDNRSNHSYPIKRANSGGQLRNLDLTQEDYFINQTKYVKLELVIEDNGVGIEEHNINKLFKDYSKLDEHAEIN